MERQLQGSNHFWLLWAPSCAHMQTHSHTNKINLEKYRWKPDGTYDLIPGHADQWQNRARSCKRHRTTLFHGPFICSTCTLQNPALRSLLLGRNQTAALPLLDHLHGHFAFLPHADGTVTASFPSNWEHYVGIKDYAPSAPVFMEPSPGPVLQ